MAVTVTVQSSNPTVIDVGTPTLDNVTINSGRNNGDQVAYYIMRQDEQPFWTEIPTGRTARDANSNGNNVIRISTFDTATHADVTSIDSRRLVIRLDNNTKYKARVEWRASPFTNRWPTGTTFESWVNFTTRDKNFKTPDAITQITTTTTENSFLYPNKKMKKRIVVSNNAKNGVVVRTARGATINNPDNGYIGTSSVVNTSRGATITNVNYYNERKGRARPV